MQCCVLSEEVRDVGIAFAVVSACALPDEGHSRGGQAGGQRLGGGGVRCFLRET